MTPIARGRFGEPPLPAHPSEESDAAAATSPLAFALITLIATALLDGFHISKVGVDFVASLASAAPYFVVAIAIGWVNFFRSRR